MRDYDWYCPYCETYKYDDEVIKVSDVPDYRCQFCGNQVEGAPDPQYPHGGYDTLEEKWL